MKTKEKILDAALTLFNARGSAAVSTNHIAEAAGISPGNLYYHFSNKEEIIRALFERLFAEWDVTFELPPDTPPSFADVQHLVRENFRIISAFAFIHRELIALLRQDGVLHARFLTIRERGYTGFNAIFAALTASGTFIPSVTPETVTRLAELCWLISEFWVSSLEVSGQGVSDAHMQRGVDLMLFALAPYLNR